MSELALKCFGTGDGWPGADRGHSSYLYRFDSATVLVDCGESVSCRYKASGLDYNLIDQIFLTHLHSDHVGGLFMLMQGFWLEQRTKHLTIQLPAEGEAPLRQMLKAAYLFEGLFAFRTRFSPLRARRSVKVGDVRVTPYPTTHLDSLRQAFQKEHPQPFEAFSLLFESGGKRVVHSGDLGAVEDLHPLLAKPVDLLVVEVAHFVPENLYSFLRNRPVKKVALIHLARQLRSNLTKTRREARRELGDIEVLIPQDGEEILVE